MELKNWEQLLAGYPASVDVADIPLPGAVAGPIQVGMLRLDGLHPDVSGNKLFKIFFYLQQAVQESKSVITFGGHFSNHLAAVSYACNKAAIPATAIIRGELTSEPSPTLQFCQQQNMRLIYVNRVNYTFLQKQENYEHVVKLAGDGVIIPEGGYGKKGVQGAAFICKHPAITNATHICVSVGSATTLAGILTAAKPGQKILAFPAIKNMSDIPLRLNELAPGISQNPIEIITGYHFGGFAKYDPLLIHFMNNFYEETAIPLDVVYTSKMMFGIRDLIRQHYFPPGANIIALHTGGLQGNKGLPPGTLQYHSV